MRFLLCLTEKREHICFVFFLLLFGVSFLDIRPQSGGANLIPLAGALLAGGALAVPWTLAACSWAGVFGSASLWLIVGLSATVHHAPVLRSGLCAVTWQPISA